MYPSTHDLSNRSRNTWQTWLAIGGALAAVLALLILVASACNARSDRDPLAGATTTTPTNSAEPTEAPDPADQGEPAGGVGTGGGDQGDGGGDQGDGGGDQGDGGGDQGDGGGDEGEAEEPPAPLTIEASVDIITPGGQCFASGTIEVSGGEYPVTVHYQWRRLVLGGGFEGEPVSAVHNVGFSEPGAVQVQTNNLPEDGTNVFLSITGPKQTGSGLIAYDGCTDGPGDIKPPGS
jgi:hypothetical protein